MSLLGIKYSVPSEGKLGNSLIWRIYRDVDKGYTDTVYVEHLEITEGVDSWTGENLYSIGFSLLVEGELEIYTDKESGLRHARVYKGE